MPNKQLIVYDKRKEAIEQKKPFWFKIWDINPKNKNQQVWRVEIRAGKNCLSQKFNITTFTDIENSIGDIFLHITSDIRYVEANQNDSNISRARMHHLWIELHKQLETIFEEYRSGLCPNQIKECFKEEKIKIHQDQIIGNALSLLAAEGMEEQEVLENAPYIIFDLLTQKIEQKPHELLNKFNKSKDRMRFITNTM
ncbi:MAG: hypothetical protein GY804_00745 [Alphaproteobacteria bacterium]|nr:hypothetical protein [Alphaproteobacteria bacterium]